MKDKRKFARPADPIQQDVDDLIFWEQSGPRVSQR